MNTTPAFDLNKLIDRVKRVITDPAGCWDTISAENATPKELTIQYIAPLAVLGEVCAFIGEQVFGIGYLIGTYRPPFFSSLIDHIVGVGLSIAAVFVVAAIMQKVAPSFGGNADFNRAFSFVTHTGLPGMAVKPLMIIPSIGRIAALFGIYGLYLLYLGTPKMTGVPEDKRIPFILVMFLCAAVTIGIILWISHLFVSGPSLPVAP